MKCVCGEPNSYNTLLINGVQSQILVTTIVVTNVPNKECVEIYGFGNAKRNEAGKQSAVGYSHYVLLS